MKDPKSVYARLKRANPNLDNNRLCDLFSREVKSDPELLEWTLWEAFRAIAAEQEVALSALKSTDKAN